MPTTPAVNDIRFRPETNVWIGLHNTVTEKVSDKIWDDTRYRLFRDVACEIRNVLLEQVRKQTRI